ncbi:hypothetical protein FRB90_009715 [Tulasnella sp. 427]|nr:hypothetical protein FRB90_009715 [Tulasnella sp. 427]
MSSTPSNPVNPDHVLSDSTPQAATISPAVAAAAKAGHVKSHSASGSPSGGSSHDGKDKTQSSAERKKKWKVRAKKTGKALQAVAIVVGAFFTVFLCFSDDY